jgi:hypothetical protein
VIETLSVISQRPVFMGGGPRGPKIQDNRPIASAMDFISAHHACLNDTSREPGPLLEICGMWESSCFPHPDSLFFAGTPLAFRSRANDVRSTLAQCPREYNVQGRRPLVLRQSSRSQMRRLFDMPAVDPPLSASGIGTLLHSLNY